MKTFRVAMAAALLTAVGAIFGSAQSAAAEIEWMDVTLSEAGSLSLQLGERLTDIDSLVVRGQMNAADFTTLSKAVYEGKLRVLDIEKTTVEVNKIPAGAFLDPSPIMDGEFWVKPGHGLRKIILPSGVEEIGDGAFAFEGNLTTVVFPAGLKTVGEGAFEKCCYFINSQNLPEGLVSIGKKAFSCCGRMGDITIPAGVKEIPDSAFFHTSIGSITFVEGLETICGRAFEFCFINELRLPESCVNFPGEGQFAFNGLHKVVLPENMTTIPAYFADNSNVNGVCLRELVLPKNVETMGSYAFDGVNALMQIVIPEGTKEIGELTFGGCIQLEKIVFPSTLESIGDRTFAYLPASTMKSIVCQAIVPPVCGEDTFTPMIPDKNCGLPVYIPVGTEEAYRKAEGWNVFWNFIETNDFTSAGIEAVTGSDKEGPIYDIMGRRVSNPVEGSLYITEGQKFIFRR